MTSLVFGNFSFDYYSHRFGLEFRLGFGLGLRLVLWVRFFSLNYEMYARTKRAPSLFLKKKWMQISNEKDRRSRNYFTILKWGCFDQNLRTNCLQYPPGPWGFVVF